MPSVIYRGVNDAGDADQDQGSFEVSEVVPHFAFYALFSISSCDFETKF